MSDRKRINLSISQSQFAEIEDMAKRGGFKGSCAFLVALIAAFIDYTKKRRQAPPKPKTIAQEIKAMFSQLETGESEQKANGQKNTKPPKGM